MNSSLDYKINKELKLPDGNLGPIMKASQKSTVVEAKQFQIGSSENNQLWTKLYEIDGYKIGVIKPGKEYFWEGDKQNINDMRPTVRRDGEPLDIIQSFTEIFELFEDLRNQDSESLELLGCILYRMAYMLDHNLNNQNKFRLSIPNHTSNRLMENFPKLGSLPIRVFIYYLEVISLNEDVKYDTLDGFDITKGTGRRNNLLTNVNLIAVLLGKQRIFKFAGALARPPSGVAPITQKAAKEFFPKLI
jgi:hypothetical protein